MGKIAFTKTLQQKYLLRNISLGSPRWKIFRTILKIDKGGTQTNRPKDKKADEHTQDLTSQRYIIGRPYMSRKEGGRKIASFMVWVAASIKLSPLVKGDSKVLFSIATTPRCRGRRFSFPWIAPLYSWSSPYNAVLTKAAPSIIFWVFDMTRPGIEPRSPGPLGNTLLIKMIHQYQDYKKKKKKKKKTKKSKERLITAATNRNSNIKRNNVNKN